MNDIKFSGTSVLRFSVMSMFFGLWTSPGIMQGVSLAYYCQENGHGFLKIIVAFLYGFSTWPVWFFGG